MVQHHFLSLLDARMVLFGRARPSAPTTIWFPLSLFVPPHVLALRILPVVLKCSRMASPPPVPIPVFPVTQTEPSGETATPSPAEPSVVSAQFSWETRVPSGANLARKIS